MRKKAQRHLIAPLIGLAIILGAWLIIFGDSSSHTENPGSGGSTIPLGSGSFSRPGDIQGGILKQNEAYNPQKTMEVKPEELGSLPITIP